MLIAYYIAITLHHYMLGCKLAKIQIVTLFHESINMVETEHTASVYFRAIKWFMNIYTLSYEVVVNAWMQTENNILVMCQSGNNLLCCNYFYDEV